MRHDFGRIRSVLGRRDPHRPSADSPALQYVVFDVLAVGSFDVRGCAWSERRQILEDHFPSGTNSVSLTDTLTASDACHERLVAVGFEGSVYKRKDSHYLSDRRSQDWLKRKARHELEVVIRHVVRNDQTVERLVCAVPKEDGRLSHVGYAEVWDGRLRQVLAGWNPNSGPQRAKVAFSSYGARGEVREARVTAVR